MFNYSCKKFSDDLKLSRNTLGRLSLLPSVGR